MSPFYESVDLNTRERVSLAPGSYGTSTIPGLKIVSYIDKASKLDKTGAMRHSFLVAATRPSREQLQSHNNGGSTTPFGEPDYEGTAFMALTIHDDWKHPAALALAWTESSRNKEGVIQKDYVAAEIQSGVFTQEMATQGAKWYRDIARKKVMAANTPADQIEEKVEKQYRSELVQIQIKMRNLFDLCDWKGIPRDPGVDVTTLVGTEFSGKVEASNVGTGSEVSTVYSKSAKKEIKQVA